MTTITRAPTGEELVERAKALAPRIRERADEIERERRLPDDIVLAIAEAGLFRMAAPRSLGGSEADLVTVTRVVEEIAAADGSAGWCVGQGINTVRAASQVHPDIAREIFFSDPVGVGAGSAAPRGKAVSVPGGYRITGDWRFASGINHATSLYVACRIFDGDEQRLRPNGVPAELVALLPVDAAEIHDTWHVSGLRGTGSHDITIDDVFVAEERTYSRQENRPHTRHAFSMLPGYDVATCTFTSVATGIARGAIDELKDLAGVKTPRTSSSLLRERAMAQTQVATAEALLRSSRAFLHEAAGDEWAAALAGGPITPHHRAMLRLAGTHNAHACQEAVNQVVDAAGTTAVYATSPLERMMRDVHVVSTHIQVQRVNYESVGRVLFGLESNSPLF